MIRRPEWQESSLVSGTIWVVVTLVVYNVVAQFGHGWKVNVAVSLAADMVLYLLARFKIWEKRRSGITRSAAFWFGWWAFFVIFNAGLAWLIMGRADVGTFLSRVILGLYGGLMNPVVFKFRDKFIFPPKTAIP
ncbi:hypothetical protein HY380_00790 [Candidatus Saccharibacteria bacterium]|nr:hypothetical protein [Candidatus Saccharibacteria bacterium]